MKIFKKYLWTLVCAALAAGMSACSDSDDYTPAQPVPDDCQVVYFDASNATEYEIAPEETEGSVLTVTLSRLYATQEATVPLKVIADDVFSVPSSVTFAAGSTTATLPVTLSAATEGTYDLEISIEDEHYANPYIEVEGSPLYSITLTVVKWNLLGTGTFYYNGMWSGADSSQKLYQKDGTNIYKLPDWGGGIDLMFTMDSNGVITVAQQYIGADHSTYGAVYITSTGADATSYYDGNRTYYFNCRYIVSAGSFGTMYEAFVLTQPAQ